MVDPAMPWSLKGISDEAREYAKYASAEADMPVGSWLSAVIHAAAREDLLAAAEEHPEAADSMLAGRSGNTIERAVEFVSSFGMEPEGPVRDEDLIEDPDFLQAEIDALERRLAEAETRTDEAAGPLVREIERLQQRLDRLRSR
ncbi:MAG: hypothetical protein WD470_02615 [Rhodospirillaceae bacterium]